MSFFFSFVLKGQSFELALVNRLSKSNRISALIILESLILISSIVKRDVSFMGTLISDIESHFPTRHTST